MRCQFFDAPKEKGKTQHYYSRLNVNLQGFEPIKGAVRCPGTVNVKLSVSHEGGYGSCSYDLEVQYSCDVCGRIQYRSDTLPRSVEAVCALLQQEVDMMTDKKFDVLVDRAESQEILRRKEASKIMQRVLKPRKKK